MASLYNSMGGSSSPMFLTAENKSQDLLSGLEYYAKKKEFEDEKWNKRQAALVPDTDTELELLQKGKFTPGNKQELIGMLSGIKTSIKDGIAKYQGIPEAYLNSQEGKQLTYQVNNWMQSYNNALVNYEDWDQGKKKASEKESLSDPYYNSNFQFDPAIPTNSDYYQKSGDARTADASGVIQLVKHSNFNYNTTDWKSEVNYGNLGETSNLTSEGIRSLTPQEFMSADKQTQYLYLSKIKSGVNNAAQIKWAADAALDNLSQGAKYFVKKDFDKDMSNPAFKKQFEADKPKGFDDFSYYALQKIQRTLQPQQKLTANSLDIETLPGGLYNGHGANEERSGVSHMYNMLFTTLADQYLTPSSIYGLNTGKDGVLADDQKDEDGHPNYVAKHVQEVEIPFSAVPSHIGADFEKQFVGKKLEDVIGKNSFIQYKGAFIPTGQNIKLDDSYGNHKIYSLGNTDSGENELGNFKIEAINGVKLGYMPNKNKKGEWLEPTADELQSYSEGKNGIPAERMGQYLKVKVSFDDRRLNLSDNKMKQLAMFEPSKKGNYFNKVSYNDDWFEGNGLSMPWSDGEAKGESIEIYIPVSKLQHAGATPAEIRANDAAIIDWNNKLTAAYNAEKKKNEASWNAAIVK